MANLRVLVVCSVAPLADQVCCVLAAEGYQVRTERDGLAGLDAVEVYRPALVVLDWALPFITGEIFARALHAVFAEPPPIVALVRNELTAPKSGGWITVAPVEDLSVLTTAVERTLRNRHCARP